MSANYTFCTIITKDHIPYVKTLSESINRFDKEVQLQALLVDSENESADSDQIKYRSSGELNDVKYYNEIKKKYFTKHKRDRYRWSLKPVFINHLLANGFDKVIYVDSDIYFYEDYHFLFDLLKDSHAILTPHWRSQDPTLDLKNFSRNFTEGLFNGGFVGFNNQGKDLIDWWAKMCAYKCERIPKKGFYDDQGYLTLLPLMDPKVRIIQHRGCNVAAWNLTENRRSNLDDRILINGEYPVIFIHYTNSLFDQYNLGKEKVLETFIFNYIDDLIRNGLDQRLFSKAMKKLLRERGINLS